MTYILQSTRYLKPGDEIISHGGAYFDDLTGLTVLSGAVRTASLLPIVQIRVTDGTTVHLAQVGAGEPVGTLRT